MSLEDERKVLYRRKDHVVARKIAGDLVLVPIRGQLADMQRIFTLNDVGESIWNRLDGKTDRRSISAAIQEEYDVIFEEADRDVEEFLALLLEAGLLEVFEE